MKSEVIKLYLCSKHALNSAALDAGIGDNSCPPARFYIPDAVGDFPHAAETCMMTVESAIISSHVSDQAYAISANIPQVNVLQSSSSAGVNSVRHAWQHHRSADRHTPSGYPSHLIDPNVDTH